MNRLGHNACGCHSFTEWTLSETNVFRACPEHCEGTASDTECNEREESRCSSVTRMRFFVRLRRTQNDDCVPVWKTENNRGFTFLELLIAVTMFSISAVAIYSSFNVGIHAWRKAEDSYKVRQEARQALSVMSRELRSALSFKLKNLDDSQRSKDSFDGSSDEISFWRALRIADSKEGYPAGIYKVTYKLVEEGKKNEKENEETRSLCRVFQSYGQDVNSIEGEKDSGSIFLSGLSGFKLEYAYVEGEEISWQSDWKDEKELLPFMVKVTLSFPSKGKTEAVEFTETILIPTGELKTQEEERQP